MTDVPPTYLGMVLCDNVLRDPETRKHFLLGTATETQAPAFPARYPKLCVYTALTGVHGSASVTLKVVRTDPESGSDVELMNLPGELKAPDPVAVAELTLAIHNLMFPAAGQYRFQLWSGDTLLGERRFMVKPMRRTSDGS